MNMSEVFSLAKAYEKHFKIGAAISSFGLSAYRGLLLRHFSSVTPENEMKYALTEPEEGQFQFERADAIVAMAQEMGVKVRVHAPVWHNQTPAWMYQDGDRPASPELIYARIDAHSKALCQRYNGDVYAWDVVNEATRDDPLDPAKAPEESPVYRSYADVIDCVTTWGVADDRTWLDGFGMNRNLPKIKQHPLLFDENRQAKPCVRQLLDAVKE